MKKSNDIHHRVIERCLHGDIRAQNRLYRMFSTSMYNIAFRILGNRMDAEDILQDSFITAFSRLHEMEDPAAFPGWLKRIVVNNCISFQRKKKPVFGDLEEYRSGDSPGEEAEWQRVDPAVVNRAIMSLPEGGRTILVLYALEGYRHREVAEMLGVTESTSRTQYSRALALLRKELKSAINEK